MFGDGAVVAVQPKPVGSPARAPTRSRRIPSPLPAPAGHRPPRRAAQGPALADPRVRSPLVATHALPRRSRNRGRRSLRDGVAALLFVFVAATLVMVAAVIVVGIVDRLWVLVPVMLVDFATTFGVVTYILRLLADDGESPA
jgi:hypothetical protein